MPTPAVDIQMRRSQHRHHIGADGVKGDVAQIQQAGIADHNIQPQRQHGVEQAEVQDAHPGLPHEANRKRRDQQPTASSRMAIQIFGSSGALRHFFTHQAGRAEHQHRNQHQEGKNVLILAAEHIPGQGPM
jgi:hypothetical protein